MKIRREQVSSGRCGWATEGTGTGQSCAWAAVTVLEGVSGWQAANEGVSLTPLMASVKVHGLVPAAHSWCSGDICPFPSLLTPCECRKDLDSCALASLPADPEPQGLLQSTGSAEPSATCPMLMQSSRAHSSDPGVDVPPLEGQAVWRGGFILLLSWAQLCPAWEGPWLPVPHSFHMSRPPRASGLAGGGAGTVLGSGCHVLGGEARCSSSGGLRGWAAPGLDPGSDQWVTLDTVISGDQLLFYIVGMTDPPNRFV